MSSAYRMRLRDAATVADSTAPTSVPEGARQTRLSLATVTGLVTAVWRAIGYH